MMNNPLQNSIGMYVDGNLYMRYDAILDTLVTTVTLVAYFMMHFIFALCVFLTEFVIQNKYNSMFSLPNILLKLVVYIHLHISRLFPPGQSRHFTSSPTFSQVRHFLLPEAKIIILVILL
jgi:hypothetical protein